MAYGKFIDYAPGPAPDSYLFNQQGGAPILLSGPPAANLKARLDASAGLAGQRVAGPGGGAPADTVPPDSVMAGSGALNAPAPMMSVAPPAPAAPAMSVAPSAALPPNAPTVENARAALAEGAPAPAVAAPPGPQPISYGGMNSSNYRLGPNGELQVRTPGAAAVTPQQLQTKAASAVLMPHSATESVQGGFDPDKDYLERRADLAVNKELLVDKAADAEAQNAAREQALAAQQMHDADVLRAQEQAHVNELQARVKQDEATKDKLMNEYGSAKVNPQRIFSGQTGTARAVLGILGAALGQAGSGMMQVAGRPGQPNLAFQAFQSMIDRDIAAQENEIKVKGAMADNALTQFQRSGLSLDQAKSALRAAQLQWGASQLANNAAIGKGSMVDVNRDMTLNSIQSALNDQNEQYRQLSLGTHSRSMAEQAMYPSKGSPGGWRDATLSEEQSANRYFGEQGKTTAETAKTSAETQKAIADANKIKAGAQPHESAELHSALDNLDNAAASAGLTPNKEGGYSGDAAGVWRTGGGIGSSDKSRQFNNALRAVAPEVLKAQGERVTPQAVDAWMSRAQSMSGEQVKSFLEEQRKALEVRRLNELKYPAKAGAAATAAEPAEEGEKE